MADEAQGIEKAALFAVLELTEEALRLLGGDAPVPSDASVTDAGVLCYEAAALLEAVMVRRGAAQSETSANTAVIGGGATRTA